MGIKVDLDEDLEKEFRELAMRKFGYSKGSIKKATESAIRQWTATEIQAKPASMGSRKQKKSGTDLLTGLLKNVKHKGSVEEQHEIGSRGYQIAQ
jgi:hypothetical protein